MKIELDNKDSTTLILGLERLQSEAKKMSGKADALNNKEIKNSLIDYYNYLEDLKTRLL
ncbi:MAG: hypothetical protein ACEQSB_06120 [Undibacterium sp.]